MLRPRRTHTTTPARSRTPLLVPRVPVRACEHGAADRTMDRLDRVVHCTTTQPAIKYATHPAATRGTPPTGARPPWRDLPPCAGGQPSRRATRLRERPTRRDATRARRWRSTAFLRRLGRAFLWQSPLPAPRRSNLIACLGRTRPQARGRLGSVRRLFFARHRHPARRRARPPCPFLRPRPTVFCF